MREREGYGTIVTCFILISFSPRAEEEDDDEEEEDEEEEEEDNDNDNDDENNNDDILRLIVKMSFGFNA